MARKSSKTPALISVSHDVEIVDDVFTLVLPAGGALATIKSANLQAFNAILEKMGYKPVRTTRNLMNKDAGMLVIDADTPISCDVGSETYWSM